MTVEQSPRPLIGAGQAAHRLNISRAKLYDLSRLQIIPSVSIGRAKRWDPVILEEWVRRGGGAFEAGWKKDPEE